MMMFKDILDILQTEIKTPIPYGAFHLIWLFCALLIIVVLYYKRKNNCEKQLKLILGIYGIIAFVLEFLKQIIWSVEYDTLTNSFLWDYQWYAFPFQLCTTPIYVCLISLFLKKNKVRDALLSYMAFTTILGSISSALLPDSLFVSDLLVDIHTMCLHLGSLVVSVYLLMSKEVVTTKKSFINSIIVFSIFILIANILNIIIYNSGILNGESFNMFYISPYFESSLPIFDEIQANVPYPIFLISYIVILTLGSYIIYNIAKLLNRLKKQ